MKFTLRWLLEYLEIDASINENERLKKITDTLTAIGLEVESVENPAEKLAAFTVAKIQSASRHPEADKLQVCNVLSDVGELQIVCGAANARAGLYVALAKEGAYIPGADFTIKKTKIRGVESNGMLCSFEELGIAGDSSGIIELPESPIGSPVATALGLDDAVIDIAITPNRADCLGVYGIARDLAAAGLGTLKPLANHEPRITNHESRITTATPSCPHFIGVHVRGVKNVPSPEWLQNRLKAVGQKPISALVDITNYFTLTYGRPLHVFDAAKLRGNLCARAAKDSETLEALNGKTYTLDSTTTVIADDSGAVGIAGIIGGEATACSDTTTDVVLEAAYFDPVNIAQTGRALEILSDARYRFERGVDPAFTEPAAHMAAAMITELCGGEVVGISTAGEAPISKREIAFSPARVALLGGVNVPEAECLRILERLGFVILTPHALRGKNLGKDPSAAPQDDTHCRVQVPSFRADIEGEADLVEEILRIHGYAHIPTTPLPRAEGTRPTTPPLAVQRQDMARQTLVNAGMLEVCSYSFIPQAQAEMFGGGGDALRLQNPISIDLACMRPSLIPNLLAAVHNNQNRSVDNLALCEIGVQFSGVLPEEQANVAAGVRAGNVAQPTYATGIYQNKSRAVDAFDAKADALAVLGALGVNTQNLAVSTSVPAWYHPGKSGALMLGKAVLAHFGELHPRMARAFDLGDTPLALCEIFLDAAPQPRAKGKARSPLKLSDFQKVERDFAFTVDAATAAATLTSAIAKAHKEWIQDVRVFDVYSGKGVEDGKKSVAIKVTLQAADRTLTEADLTAVADAVIKAAHGVGAALRG